MADDNSVEIQFSAATDEVITAIDQVREAMSGITAAIGSINASLTQFSASLVNALSLPAIDQAAQSVANIGTQAQGSARAIGTMSLAIQSFRQGLAQEKILLDAEANQFQITQNQKFALLEAATEREFEQEWELLDDKQSLYEKDSEEYKKLEDRKSLLEAKHNTEMLKLDEQAIAKQQQMWTSALGTIETAFNSQLRGLLAGTTSWSQAFKNILGDVIIKFIEMCEQMVVKWLAAELAQTTASTSGAAARAAAQQTGAASGILANAANAMQAIMADAAQTFAGVFAFLAPTMGPAAAGPAAAAQASVSAAAIFDVGTDYVVRGGLALIHPGETIIPAARGSGPFTGANMSPQIHAPVSISVSALDSQSVARFFNDNSKHMLRAINDAVKRGANIGLRAIHP